MLLFIFCLLIHLTLYAMEENEMHDVSLEPPSSITMEHNHKKLAIAIAFKKNGKFDQLFYKEYPTRISQISNMDSEDVVGINAGLGSVCLICGAIICGSALAAGAGEIGKIGVVICGGCAAVSGCLLVTLAVCGVKRMQLKKARSLSWLKKLCCLPVHNEEYYQELS